MGLILSVAFYGRAACHHPTFDLAFRLVKTISLALETLHYHYMERADHVSR
jgi:hypothetical protein